MSLVALKKKTAAKYNNMSTNGKFSLNGTKRLQGFVGQTSLSRSINYTPMKGNTAKGHGGNGIISSGPIKPSYITCLEEDSIKDSTLNTKSMIRNKYKYVWRPAPYSSVKPDSNQNENTSGSYTTHVRKEALNENESCVNPSTRVSTCANKNNNCDYTKDKSEYTSVDSSVFIEKLRAKCIENDKFFVPSNVCRLPIM